MQPQVQPLARKAVSTPAAFFLALPLFPMNRFMMVIVPQLPNAMLHLHLDDLSSFGCCWVILGCRQEALPKLMLLTDLLLHKLRKCVLQDVAKEFTIIVGLKGITNLMINN